MLIQAECWCCHVEGQPWFYKLHQLVGNAERSKMLHPCVRCAVLALFLNGLLQIFTCCQVSYLQDKKLNVKLGLKDALVCDGFSKN